MDAETLKDTHTIQGRVSFTVSTNFNVFIFGALFKLHNCGTPPTNLRKQFIQFFAFEPFFNWYGHLVEPLSLFV